MPKKIPITVAYGDGIGPEIMSATLHILSAADAPLEIHEVEIGEKIYLKGHKTGITPSTWDIIRKTKVFLKAPITTPQGGGFKSLNVTIRTTLGLYANIRPCVSYYPFIHTKHPNMDVVIIRENEEDLYSGIEYRQTPDVCQSLKMISRPGSEKIIRYAFDYATWHHRKKVTCFTKDNIMKFSDGLFHKIFDEIALEYPQIENEHWIVDIGAAKLADTPEVFDVIVMPNLYGDILSDVGAQISGSVGLVGSANIGDHGAMFEAIHGSAPRRAGQNVANPSALILASVMMLQHIHLSEIAKLIHNALLKTLEDGVHTYDIYSDTVSKEKVGTKEFADAVISRLGQKPKLLKPVSYKEGKMAHGEKQRTKKMPAQSRELVGVDVYVYADESAEKLQKRAISVKTDKLYLTFISNRGVRIYPEGLPETFCIDQWRLRFLPIQENASCTMQDILEILSLLEKKGFDITKTEHLYLFDGVPGYSSAYG
jgi:isocitrate dehydrogenase